MCFSAPFTIICDAMYSVVVVAVVAVVDPFSAATAYQKVAGDCLPQLKQQTLPDEHLKLP